MSTDPLTFHRSLDEIDLAIEFQAGRLAEVKKYRTPKSEQREQEILDALLEERQAAAEAQK